MSKSKRHHYLPKFYIDYWNNENDLVIIFFKDGSSRVLEVSSKDICFKKNLYTRRNSVVDVETVFFEKIDGNASQACRTINEKGLNMLSSAEKEYLAVFINTLHSRSPELINEMRVYNEQRRQDGEKWAELKFNETGEDIRDNFKKEKYCDSPALLEYFSKGKDYLTLFRARWHIFENTSQNNFITCDFPLHIIRVGGPNKHGIELPDEFIMTLPLSPSKLLIITNKESLLETFIGMDDFVIKVNQVTIGSARELIISKDKRPEKFVLENLLLLERLSGIH